MEQAALLASTLEQLEAAKTTAREAEEKVQQADAQRDQALADLRTAQEVRKPQSHLTDRIPRADVLSVSMQALSSVRSVDEASGHELVEATQRCKALEERVRRWNHLFIYMGPIRKDNFSVFRVSLRSFDRMAVLNAVSRGANSPSFRCLQLADSLRAGAETEERLGAAQEALSQATSEVSELQVCIPRPRQNTGPVRSDFPN